MTIKKTNIQIKKSDSGLLILGRSFGLGCSSREINSGNLNLIGVEDISPDVYSGSKVSTEDSIR